MREEIALVSPSHYFFEAKENCCSFSDFTMGTTLLQKRPDATAELRNDEGEGQMLTFFQDKPFFAAIIHWLH